ncbi:MAG: 30S ribosomal protein S9 [Candidatus Heimdallarchaeota archaeon]|nr:30S ribosomal protein S9 [Candidatus Heimdallarchaeota archaeon]MDH5646841.1 30S ribosomal protein S9 [Candidatus Heimdallarchaeota archaeon]
MAKKIILTAGKRRTAIARARLMKTKTKEEAIIRINGVPIDQVEPIFARNIMQEPVLLASKLYKNDLAVKIRVSGGGIISQAQAVRMALARGLYQYLGTQEIRDIYNAYDKTMISGDVRRTEPKKYGGKGARARFQKSYR